MKTTPILIALSLLSAAPARAGLSSEYRVPFAMTIEIFSTLPEPQQKLYLRNLQSAITEIGDELARNPTGHLAGRLRDTREQLQFALEDLQRRHDGFTVGGQTPKGNEAVTDLPKFPLTGTIHFITPKGVQGHFDAKFENPRQLTEALTEQNAHGNQVEAKVGQQFYSLGYGSDGKAPRLLPSQGQTAIPRTTPVDALSKSSLDPALVEQARTETVKTAVPEAASNPVVGAAPAPVQANVQVAPSGPDVASAPPPVAAAPSGPASNAPGMTSGANLICTNVGVIHRSCSGDNPNAFDPSSELSAIGFDVSRCAQRKQKACSPLYGVSSSGALNCSADRTLSCQHGDDSGFLRIASRCAAEAKKGDAGTAMISLGKQRIDCRALKTFFDDQAKLIAESCAQPGRKVACRNMVAQLKQIGRELAQNQKELASAYFSELKDAFGDLSGSPCRLDAGNARAKHGRKAAATGQSALADCAVRAPATTSNVDKQAPAPVEAVGKGAVAKPGAISAGENKPEAP